MRCVVLSIAVLNTSVLLNAQTPRQLGPASMRSSEEFSRIAGVRELSDGRVIVSDAGENRLALLSASGHLLTTIGRVGSGPAEYGRAVWIFAAGGDSTQMADIMSRRIVTILPNGTIADRIERFGMDGWFALPSARDPAGRYLGNGALRAAADGPSETPVIRWAPGGRPDTIVITPHHQSLDTRYRADANGTVSEVGAAQPPAFARAPRWVASSAGDVAVIHVNPYRVDWIDANGTTRRGAPIAYEPVPVTNVDRQAWAAAQQRAAKPIMALSPGSRERARAQGRTKTLNESEEGSRQTRSTTDPDAWTYPTHKPAWEDALMDSEGKVWIRRYRPAALVRELYDVVDRSASVVHQVELPAGRTVVGFGANTVYLIATDENDLQTLERYRVP